MKPAIYLINVRGGYGIGYTVTLDVNGQVWTLSPWTRTPEPLLMQDDDGKKYQVGRKNFAKLKRLHGGTEKRQREQFRQALSTGCEMHINGDDLEKIWNVLCVRFREDLEAVRVDAK